MKIALAQLNATVGDLSANVDRLIRAVHSADAAGADLVVAPELAICGYPPRDLLDRPAFIQDNLAALRRLVDKVQGPKLIVGAIVGHGKDPLSVNSTIANAAVLIENGAITGLHRKVLLPTYDVFDEARYFTPGDIPTVLTIGNHRVGLSVCEDIWNDKDYWRTPRYDRDPIAEQVEAGAEILINISASPYERGKPSQRQEMMQATCRRHQKPLIYVNQVGGNDSLIFDGASTCFDGQGQITAALPTFREAGDYVTLTDAPAFVGERHAPHNDWRAEVSDALCLGLADYLHKCRFDRAIIGLSGGIDSALTAALAVRALGPKRVMGVTMPSRYSSDGAAGDAFELGRRLGIRVDEISIEPMFKSFLGALEKPFADLPADVTEENIQARIRGLLLMAYSNKLGALLLTTGNKSELAVGYATLYGDMCGGLAVISDLYKTEVWEIAHYLNSEGEAVIPESTLTKPPSAELRAEQKDSDSLPDYPILDAVLRDYIDNAMGVQALIKAGHVPELVHRVVAMVDRAEYKRRQMPPGLRISRKAFGEGRRLPIAQAYSGIVT